MENALREVLFEKNPYGDGLWLTQCGFEVMYLLLKSDVRFCKEWFFKNQQEESGRSLKTRIGDYETYRRGIVDRRPTMSREEIELTVNLVGSSMKSAKREVRRFLANGGEVK